DVFTGRLNQAVTQQDDTLRDGLAGANQDTRVGNGIGWRRCPGQRRGQAGDEKSECMFHEREYLRVYMKPVTFDGTGPVLPRSLLILQFAEVDQPPVRILVASLGFRLARYPLQFRR